MKKFLIAILILALTNCGSNSINNIWIGYELGQTVPSNWYVEINGEQVNAIHSLRDGSKESYKGTIKFKKEENDIKIYDVFFDLGYGVGFNYSFKLATDRNKYFGLYDNSGNDKFPAIMKLEDADSGTIIYLERK